MFVFICVQVRGHEFSPEHQQSNAAFALESPQRHPPARQRHVWLLPPVCHLCHYPRITGGPASTSNQVSSTLRNGPADHSSHFDMSQVKTVDYCASQDKQTHKMPLQCGEKYVLNVVLIKNVLYFESNRNVYCIWLLVSVPSVSHGQSKAPGWIVMLRHRAKTLSSQRWSLWCSAPPTSSSCPQM